MMNVMMEVHMLDLCILHVYMYMSGYISDVSFEHPCQTLHKLTSMTRHTCTQLRTWTYTSTPLSRPSDLLSITKPLQSLVLLGKR